MGSGNRAGQRVAAAPRSVPAPAVAYPFQSPPPRLARRDQRPADSARALSGQELDLAQDRRCVIDSLPVPVIAFHLVPAANRADWQAYEARFGRVPSKKSTIFGYKLYLLVTLSGVILDFLLAPANVGELQAGEELLTEHTDLATLGDKAFISQAVAARLREENRVQLLTLPRRNALQPLPPPVRRRLNGARQVVETVNSQLTEQFHLEVNHAQSFWGLTARLLTKLTAHTLCLYLNRCLDRPDVLQIKHLAFPI